MWEINMEPFKVFTFTKVGKVYTELLESLHEWLSSVDGMMWPRTPPVSKKDDQFGDTQVIKQARARERLS